MAVAGKEVEIDEGLNVGASIIGVGIMAMTGFGMTFRNKKNEEASVFGILIKTTKEEIITHFVWDLPSCDNAIYSIWKLFPELKPKDNEIHF